jgi:rsbT co-antagonist protein RsbR
MAKFSAALQSIFSQHETQILEDWLAAQKVVNLRNTIGRENEIRAQSADFLRAFSAALQADQTGDINSAAWASVKDFLEGLSRTRAKQGFTPSETALFVFSLKEPIFKTLRTVYAKDAQGLAEESLAIMTLIDQLGLYTVEIFQKTREEIIARQQQELMELSTPVVRLWDEVLALPLIGTLDSARTQVVMENLLQEIVQTGASIAIIDITGVPTVDTLVAQHLLKTVAAARLMGADCIISGIRPQIAQTIVHLGVELGDVLTKATLADAFAYALMKTGKTVVSRRQIRNSGLNAEGTQTSQY